MHTLTDPPWVVGSIPGTVANVDFSNDGSRVVSVGRGKIFDTKAARESYSAMRQRPATV